MAQYIDKDALVAEIEGRIEFYSKLQGNGATEVSRIFGILIEELTEFLSFLDTLEVKEVDLGKQAEWIANGIMISVQSAKLHTNVYNPDRRDYDHSNLMQAARRGIELGLKIAQKGEEV